MHPNHKVKGHRLDVKKALSKSEMAAGGPGGGGSSGGGGGRRGGGRGGGGGGWGNRQNQDWGNSGMFYFTVKYFFQNLFSYFVNSDKSAPLK